MAFGNFSSRRGVSGRGQAANGAAPKRPGTILVVAALVLLAPAVLIGCGGEAEPSAKNPPTTSQPSSPSTPEQEELLVDQVDGVSCKDGESCFEEDPLPSGPAWPTSVCQDDLTGQATPEEVRTAEFPITKDVSAYDGRVTLPVEGTVTVTVARYDSETTARATASALRSESRGCIRRGSAILPGFAASTQLSPCEVSGPNIPASATESAYSVTGVSSSGGFFRGCALFLTDGDLVAQAGIVWTGIAGQNRFSNELRPLIDAASAQQQLMSSKAARDREALLAADTPWNSLGNWLKSAPTAQALKNAGVGLESLTEQCAAYSDETVAFAATGSDSQGRQIDIRAYARQRADGTWIVNDVRADVESAGQVTYEAEDSYQVRNANQGSILTAGCEAISKEDASTCDLPEGGIEDTVGRPIARDVRVRNGADCDTATAVIKTANEPCDLWYQNSSKDGCSVQVESETWKCAPLAERKSEYPYSYTPYQCTLSNGSADAPAFAFTGVDYNLGG